MGERRKSPFAQRKGARGMPTRHSHARENPEGKGGENHGNLYPIMAIMVQNLPPSHSHHVIPSTPLSFRAQRGISNVIPAQAGIQRARDGKIMAIFPPSWQSWFKTSPIRIHTPSFRALHVIPKRSEESLTSFSRRRESRGDCTGKSWQSFPHHGNHGSKPL